MPWAQQGKAEAIQTYTLLTSCLQYALLCAGFGQTTAGQASKIMMQQKGN